MNDEEVACIESYLKDDQAFFEWGSGGSTLHYSQFVKEYYSVEHNKGWFDKINAKKADNVTYNYVPVSESRLDKDLDGAASIILSRSPGVTERDGKLRWSTLHDRADWHKYVDYIKFPGTLDKKFDVVLVDGRARAFCAYSALSILKDDGVLFFHDWGREWYHSALEYYTVKEVVTNRLAVLQKII